MNKEELRKYWLSEEAVAHIHGWDFSHIDDRYEEEGDLPWDYRTVILSFLKPQMRILDVDTGGGEFLLSLGHPYECCAAMENYEPNVRLCERTLLPLGIDFKQGDGHAANYPFAEHSFDLILNRHGDVNVKEIKRLLKPNGLFITQQVGAENDRELVNLLFEDVPPLPFPKQYLSIRKKEFEDEGFQLLRQEEAFRPIKFHDVGALVWFARIIEWEFPGFSVERCLHRLYAAQELLEKDGVIEGRVHRFLLVAQMPA